MIHLPRYPFAVIALMAFLATAARTTAGIPSATLAEQYLLSAANQERAARGLHPLRRDSRLALAAQDHARAMAAHATISHQFPGEPELAARASSAGVRFSVVEENVGQAPTAVRIHDLWMHSPHHRDNLLDPAVDSVGISVIAVNGELYAVQDFAKTVQPASAAQQESAIASLVAQRGVAVLDTEASIAAARQTCAMSTGYSGRRRPSFVMRFTSDNLNSLPAELTSRIASSRFHQAAIGACPAARSGPFTSASPCCCTLKPAGTGNTIAAP